MKNRNILLLLLGLAMIQNQTSAASKHYLVQSKGKQYLIKTEGKAKNGKGTEKFLLLTFLGGTFDTFKMSENQ